MWRKQDECCLETVCLNVITAAFHPSSHFIVLLRRCCSWGPLRLKVTNWACNVRGFSVKQNKGLHSCGWCSFRGGDRRCSMKGNTSSPDPEHSQMQNICAEYFEGKLLHVQTLLFYFILTHVNHSREGFTVCAEVHWIFNKLPAVDSDLTAQHLVCMGSLQDTLCTLLCKQITLLCVCVLRNIQEIGLKKGNLQWGDKLPDPQLIPLCNSLPPCIFPLFVFLSTHCTDTELWLKWMRSLEIRAAEK